MASGPTGSANRCSTKSLYPPVAFNLFVIQNITGDSQTYVAWKVIPFFLIMMLFTAILTVFPKLVTWPVDFILSR